jgi:2',3'-cyclic-nucleotide 2'-phosphodiesterase (5'-nucleotidase family)
MFQKKYLYLLAIIFLASCSISKDNSYSIVRHDHLNGEKDFIELTIIQLNDVYEISPLEGGEKGGLARVATLKKELLLENPNTIAVLSGDFLSPSLIGTLKNDEGERIAGQQMVETLNAMGLDYATFGNHEFDLKTADLLQKRIDQSEFEYTVCNVYRSDEGKSAPFTQLLDGQREDIPPYIIKEIQGDNGQVIKMGIIGVVLPFNKRDYVAYDPVVSSFRKAYDAIKDETDFVIALTHLNVKDDLALAAEVPGVLLFLGGHDHVNMSHYVEETVITKADANAKTVYIHRITYSPLSKMAKVRSTLTPINSQIASEPVTDALVKSWEGKVEAKMKEQGYHPKEVIKTLAQGEVLECKEYDIRSRPTTAISHVAFFLPHPPAKVLYGGQEDTKTQRFTKRKR